MRKPVQTFVILVLIQVVARTAPPAEPDPRPVRKSMPDRHHLRYDTPVPNLTEAPLATTYELFTCLSCHEVDICTNQILIERDCRVCHRQDHHHSLDNTVIHAPTDAPNGIPGERYGCESCHDLSVDTGDVLLPVESNCRICHQPNTNRPIAVDDHYVMPRNTTLRIAPSGILFNDSDADGRVLSAKRVGGVSNGILDIFPDGSFAYSPKSGFAGEDSFRYVAYDGLHDSDAARVSIFVVNADFKTVAVDIVPGSQENPIYLCTEGIVPVVIADSKDLGVSSIDASSILLNGEVAPLQWRLVEASPGVRSLLLDFDMEAVVGTLEHTRIGNTYDIWASGMLTDRTHILGKDTIVLRPTSQASQEDSHDPLSDAMTE